VTRKRRVGKETSKNRSGGRGGKNREDGKEKAPKSQVLLRKKRVLWVEN
jgi:hypothetical protein